MTKKHLIQIVVFFLIAVSATAVDLSTKAWVFNRLGMPGTSDVDWQWEGVFGFETALNEGALFGMGQGFVLGFAGLSCLVLLGIVIWLVFWHRPKSWYLVIVMGMITGGIIGNLYDRLGLHGLHYWVSDGTHFVEKPVYAVRDWILIMIGSYHWPNFNFADSFLVAGVILLAIYVLFLDPNNKKTV